ncbi:hypothetical protein HDA41_000102 [Streptomyces caelestis]|uniref:Uncharacterized protein n=1 Tax=Streptomyces caelestis TaxID=36816 RepID=A0A7W9GXZ5_9ACTN|nr:hypothetical protein [Streptomyces caelestis]
MGQLARHGAVVGAVAVVDDHRVEVQLKVDERLVCGVADQGVDEPVGLSWPRESNAITDRPKPRLRRCRWPEISPSASACGTRSCRSVGLALSNACEVASRQLREAPAAPGVRCRPVREALPAELPPVGFGAAPPCHRARSQRLLSLRLMPTTDGTDQCRRVPSELINNHACSSASAPPELSEKRCFPSSTQPVGPSSRSGSTRSIPAKTHSLSQQVCQPLQGSFGLRAERAHHDRVAEVPGLGMNTRRAEAAATCRPSTPRPARREAGSPVLLDPPEISRVGARSAVVTTHRRPRMRQDIPAVGPVPQRVEPPSGIGLGRPVGRMLQGMDLIRGRTPPDGGTGLDLREGLLVELTGRFVVAV